MLKVKRALISVSDKTGLLKLAKVLKSLKVEIISTGGTLKLLKQNGIEAVSVSEMTGFPEMMDGRVKTLHPKIHGGLLYLRSKKSHRDAAKKHRIKPIDLVVANLYPFQAAARNAKTTLAAAIEHIDIGGPGMIRAGAKNYQSVGVVTDPADYDMVIQELKSKKGKLNETTLEALAMKAFQTTAAYDQAIARYLRKKLLKSKDTLPPILDVTYVRHRELRYGENPHQRAALYQRQDDEPRFLFQQLHGKELSYNNILDLEAAVDIIREFKETAVCVVKHNNPCGIAANPNLKAAAREAIECDTQSAFGGIVGINRKLTSDAAAMVLQMLPFFEMIAAPAYTLDALRLLKGRKNLRIIQVPHLDHIGPYDLRFSKSGILLQDRDEPIYRHEKELVARLRFVTKLKPTPQELKSLLFAWSCVKVVSSNAIVLVQGKRTIGFGCGQMSRVDSVRIACEKAGTLTRGSALASDGFFPMADNITLAHLHGIKSIIQPGGSIRDQEVIDACNRYNISMVMTGERHFRH
ncbi:MAG: bifunctional phosphoribosylaminoimidazolecarboxamide formyltransferase/inosine monophosphate cyclohydrolase [Candidatus Omnitrophica bacterium CG11_big_fil_rev_8_21_14_0_20_45_26]|uniref:Bifunctional purine biosynthesis protein PurH n=1 Tax=Candidatus Abzuiibacterium crystallinum TaxID=1974748 RepID=A0A2H0LQQ4_9BACT|nr:MAG: bifunctional phosphoribosylaminoimidazolecarboxamide formyltransferase/inosine monophosphate cyclohydrolase [Candidatus Omnitrophica bacterium CG11_big_fil_rev_8_21_14_0_20_45_26]PIW65515.1 MAG: bifunctional phosphoribosylaminoimidazolecarboxamide formyltransferase/inosine monophosphate cyclohydrolase [Candidatus Omnitrophica bacterium CG12_big_fil_rev_8_21_14_0_65_45_16]